METVSVSVFKATCLALLQKVRKTGRPLLVTKRGVPVAQVLPPPAPRGKKNWLGDMAGTGKIVGDIISPAVSEDEWEVLR